MYEVIQKILYDNLSISQAAARAGCSRKTIQRRLDIYLKEGAGGLVHKSRGRIAYNRMAEDIEEDIVYLYENHYQGYNFTHFRQKLSEKEGIDVAYSTLYAVLTGAGHISPKAHRAKDGKDLHPSRPRRSSFGELVQLDASCHEWFGDVICHLHLAIDDATSKIVGGHFEKEETLHGYFMVFAQMIRGYGVPEEFLTDKRTVFQTKKTKDTRLEHDTTTQFRLAAHRLGVIEIHTTSVPQAKGRVERAFQTFQDRLISEMRSAKITSYEKANQFLPGFIADHNARYASDASDLVNVFAPGPETDKEINMALSIVKERVVDRGSTVSVGGIRYAPFDRKSRQLPHPKAHVYVLHTLDDELYLVYGEKTWPLLKLDTLSMPTPEELKPKLYVPPADHPWKGESYDVVLRKLRRVG